MASSTRAFLALDLPAEARAAAADATARLRRACGEGDVKWVPPENLHVTLRFLGSLDPEALARARAVVADLDQRFDAVTVGWSRLGAFPSPRRPSVLWLGLADGEQRLSHLAREVERRLRAARFGRADKPFAAHVTIGRVRRGRRLIWPTESDRLTTPDGAFSMRAIVLYQSRLTPAGPHYAPLATARARGVSSSPQGNQAEGEVS